MVTTDLNTLTIDELIQLGDNSNIGFTCDNGFVSGFEVKNEE